VKATLLCSFCDDAIDIDDTAICKNCVDELHKNIKKLQARIAELEKRIQNAIDDVNATDKCMKFPNRIDMTKVLERIRYILTEPPREEG